MLDRALSVRQLARRWGVAPAKIRAMIRKGMIRAIDVGRGRQQVRILPEAIEQAEKMLQVRPPPPRRRQRREILDPEIEALLAD